MTKAAKFEGLNVRHRTANLDSVFYYSVFYPVVELVETIGFALIVWYGGGAGDPGHPFHRMLIAFFQYAQRFYEPISDLSEKYNILQAAMAASERIFKTLDTRTDPRRRHAGHRSLPVESSSATSRSPITTDGPRNRGLFPPLSFRVPGRSFAGSPSQPEWCCRTSPSPWTRGERRGHRRHTGAGKTTVTRSFCASYEAASAARSGQRPSTFAATK